MNTKFNLIIILQLVSIHPISNIKHYTENLTPHLHFGVGGHYKADNLTIFVFSVGQYQESMIMHINEVHWWQVDLVSNFQTGHKGSSYLVGGADQGLLSA